LPSHSIDSQHQMCNVTKQHVKHRYATSIFIKCSVLSQPFKKKRVQLHFVPAQHTSPTAGLETNISVHM